MRFQRIWLALAVVAFFITGISTALAEDDEYNFSWLDPDKKVYVLQNRRYTKNHKVMAYLMGSTGFSNPYRSDIGLSPRISFYFAEWIGLEAFYETWGNSENTTFQGLRRSSPNALPIVREMRSFMGVNAHFVPWYAKINVFNRILYFDWFFSAGAGTVSTALDTRTSINAASSYRTEEYFGLFLGTGHIYHVSQRFLVRLDYQAALYSALDLGTTGDSTWFSHSSFAAGFGLRF